MSLSNPFNMARRMIHRAVSAGFTPTYWELTDDQWMLTKAHTDSTLIVAADCKSDLLMSLPVFIRRGGHRLIPPIALFAGRADLRQRLDDLAIEAANLGRENMPTTATALASRYRELHDQHNALRQMAVEISRRLPPAIGMIILPAEVQSEPKTPVQKVS